MRPLEYPEHMPYDQQARLDRVDDPKLVKMLIDLWHSAQRYTARVEAGHDGFERHLQREREKRDAAARKGLFDRAFSGEMGPDAKQLAEHCVSTLAHGASQDALHRDFSAAWKAECEGRRRKAEQQRLPLAQPEQHGDAR